MALVNSLREIAIAQKGDIPSIDQITDSSPVIATANFQAANRGTAHVYEELKHFTTGEYVAIDGVLTEVDAEFDVKKQDIGIQGGKMYAMSDTLALTGYTAEQYFMKKYMPVAQGTLQNLETDLVYNILEAFAIANGNVINASGNANTNYSILVCRWQEDNLSGIYNPEAFNPSTLFRLGSINNGAEYEIAAKNGALGFGMYYKTYMAFLAANARNVSVIVNANKSTADAVTGTMMDDALALARAGTTGSTFIYCHPMAASRFLNKFKGDAIVTDTSNREFNRAIDRYSGVPIVTSWNFKNGTEANVTLS
jgi:hypothetical protein